MTLTKVSALIPWCLLELASEGWAESAKPLPEVDARLMAAAGLTEPETAVRMPAPTAEPERRMCDVERGSRPAARRAERVRIEQPQPGRVALRLLPRPALLYQDGSAEVDLARCQGQLRK